MGERSRPESSRSMTTSGSTTSRPARWSGSRPSRSTKSFRSGRTTVPESRLEHALERSSGSRQTAPDRAKNSLTASTRGIRLRSRRTASPWLFVEIHPSRRRDIWLMPLVGDRHARPLLATDADEWGARFSPDGQWLAYVSDETGRDEIFIRPIDSTGGRKRLSSEGGIGPMWAPDGRELFFMRGDQLAVVALDGQLNPVGRDRVLFAVPRFEEFAVRSRNSRRRPHARRRAFCVRLGYAIVVCHALQRGPQLV